MAPKVPAEMEESCPPPLASYSPQGAKDPATATSTAAGRQRKAGGLAKMVPKLEKD